MKWLVNKTDPIINVTGVIVQWLISVDCSKNVCYMIFHQTALLLKQFSFSPAITKALRVDNVN